MLKLKLKQTEVEVCGTHTRLRRTGARVASMMAMAAVLMGSTAAMAALPQTSAPSRGSSSGNFLKMMQDYGFDLFVLVGLALSAVALFKVASNCIAIYHEVGEGKKKWGDFFVHAGVGGLLAVIVVFLASQASNIL